jgi:hypothetical protein
MGWLALWAVVAGAFAADATMRHGRAFPRSWPDLADTFGWIVAFLIVWPVYAAWRLGNAWRQ